MTEEAAGTDLKSNPKKLFAPIVLPLIDGIVIVAVYLTKDVVKVIADPEVNTDVEPPEPKFCPKIGVTVRAESALAKKDIVIV
jgi:hypothetical protein